MTKSKTTGSTKKTNIGKLFSGVSGVALLLGVANGTARAAGITVTGVTSSVSVTTSSTVDFIDIDSGIVTNNVSNHGTIGVTDVGIEVRNGGFVGGSIVNWTKGTISASKTGIAVRSDTPGQNVVGGGIHNFGVINAVNISAKSTALIGINVTGSGILTSLSNGGTINVSLAGSGTGTHPAIGINVVSSGIINANVSNSGEIDIEDVWSGPADQSATATGVNISNTSPADSVNITFDNSGDIFLDVTALATVSSPVEAVADGLGVGLAGVGNASASKVYVQLSNTTSARISAEASARASGAARATASANATGAELLATGGAAIGVNVSNSGLIHASAKADAEATKALANATAVGTRQVGVGTKATVFNFLSGSNNSSGLINVTAKADASGFTATANARASGAPQTAVGGDFIDISYTNSGVVDVDVDAHARVFAPVGSAHAEAIGVGVGQSALATASTTKVYLNVFNDTKGDIDVKVTAYASKAGSAKASAAAHGVLQTAQGGTSISINMTNNGDIFAFAGAIATKATSANALAFAFGTKQVGIATKNTQINSLTANNNSGEILAGAFAIVDQADDGEADALALGAPQTAVGGATIDVSYNNSGVINAFALAKATKVDTGDADAEAVGMHQFAIATKNTVVNSVTLVNTSSGEIGGFAKAGAFADTVAKADAFGVGNAQTVIGGTSVSASLTNSGLIIGEAFAIAADTKFGGGSGLVFGSAKASAVGSHQFASGNASSTQVALSVFNDGALVAKATAKASAFDGAHALANAAGAPQTAVGGQVINVGLTNVGLINASASAFAVGTFISAFATATANATGAAQFGYGTSLTNSVTLNLANTTTGTISLGTLTGVISASAFAAAGSGPVVNANAGAMGVSQSATAGNPAGSVSITFSNNGLVNVDARALASPAGTARAQANATGTHQFGLVGPGGTNNLASINGSNGVIDVDATATARGSIAQATATANGAPQAAVGGSLILVDMNNSGDISANAAASAGGTNASAHAGAVGAFQLGSGTSGTISNIVNLINTTSGTIDASATASAFGVSFARASASAAGATQTAANGVSAIATFGNNGLIEVDAFARASALSAIANATAAGLYQIGSGNASTTFNGLSAINSASGTISVTGTARASGANAAANFQVGGIIQQQSGGLSVSGNMTNDGLIDVNGSALAFGGVVTANGSAVGLVQVGSATSATTSIDLDVTNSVSGIIDVNAAGSVAWSVTVSTNIGATGVLQGGLGGGSFDVDLTNLGSIDAQGVGYGVGAVQVGLFTSAASVDFDVVNATGAYIGAHADVVFSGNSVSAINNATGILQTASGPGIVTLDVWNAGLLDVDASAWASGGESPYAEADATGINQFVSASGGTTSVSLGVTNFATTIAATTSSPGTTITGVIDVSAHAVALGIESPQALATAGGAVNQLISGMPGGSTASTLFINQGSVNVTALAQAATSLADAHAYAWGVWQSIGGTADSASGTFTNATGASFDVSASASVTGLNASAKATAVGVWQTMYGGLSGSATVNNDGTFNVDAKAWAGTGNSPYAYAEIQTGIWQGVRASGGAGSVATATVTNTSLLSLNLSAFAQAIGSTVATATATIVYGIYQEIDAGETSAALINNSGAITMDVTALAYNTGAGNANAYATIDTGIYQFVSAPGGSQLSASAAIVNSGVIDMNISASATAPGHAYAFASVGIGISQSATTADAASVSLTNTVTGSISMDVSAYAMGSTATAQAYNSTHVIAQSAAAGSDRVSASATLVNDGFIGLQLNATAFGTDGISGPGTYANALGDVSYAFEQYAVNGATSTVTLTNNNDGTIQFGIDLLASHASSANAYFQFDTAFYQSASGNSGISDVASVSLVNSGDIIIDLQASALATSYANAHPQAYYIVEQYANHASTVSATFNNTVTGNIDADIFAFASATTVLGDANASAAFYDPYYVTIDATAGDQASASINFTNAGSMSLDVVASAEAPDDAKAFAEINTVVYLSANGGDNTSITINNSGNFTVDLVAYALADSADADASIDNYGFYLSAFAGDDTNNVINTFTNSVTGSIELAVHATAIGTDGSSGAGSIANAFATIDYGFYQYAYEGDTATVTLNNNGSMSFLAGAFASNAFSAKASASIGTGIYQSATGSGAGSTVSASITNTSLLSLNFEATAQAYGVAYAFASAEIDDYAIYQNADDGNIGSVDLTNSGLLNILAQGTAVATDGSAYAYGSINYGIWQSASAYSGPNSIATVSLTNSGILNLVANANASAFGTATSSDTAYASAYNESAFYQNAVTADVVSVSLNNSGDINIVASAHAVGLDASADASIYSDMFDQEAYNDTSTDQTSSTAILTNSGNINILGMAVAIGSDGSSGAGRTADANASIDTVVSQTAGYSLANNVTIINSSTGIFSVAAVAFASNASDVYAYADMDYGLYQYAYGSTTYTGALTVDALLDNDGTISMLVQATARATDGTGGPGATASAYASMSYPIEQYAYYGLQTTGTINNDGTLALTAIAVATNAVDAYAFAGIDTGIYQYIYGSSKAGSSATAIITNTSNTSYDVTIAALATGITQATAYATLDEELVYQYAYNAETVSATFNNSGAINVDINATAVAAGDGTSGYAYAYASMDTGIYQYVSANVGGNLSATATFVNSGSINIDVFASAVGTTDVTAYAYANTAFWQYAYDGAVLDLNFTNSGSIRYNAEAHATGGTDAFASAVATKVWQTVYASTSGVSQTLTFNNTNSGSFLANASAFAFNTNSYSATAKATAAGVNQYNGNPGTQSDATFNFTNNGNMTVAAFASASATTYADAVASALGYEVDGGTNGTPTLNVQNGGLLNVHATAVASDVATASAFGMVFNGGSIAGSGSNSGTISVTASASGSTANALAIGIQFNSPVNNSTFTNTGTIAVLAIGSTTATGIQYNGQTGHTQSATKSDLATFVNDGGTLWAGVNNGSLDFSTVINTVNAPHQVLINLQGSSQQGNIWGNVLLSGDDNILVSNGNTIWRGMINGSSTYTGALTINSGGTLTMPTVATGPFVAYVDDYTQTSSGTLAVNIFPSTGTNDLGQINAVTASLAGTIQVNVVAGLYSNSQTYQDVVVASTLSGTWSSLTTNTNTPLLSVFAVYPGDDTADLSLVRNAFNGVAGMTQNQTAAAGGIENTYSTSLTGGYGAMISEMFTFGTSTYISALEQLHGADYAQNQMANLGSMSLLNNSIDDRLNAGPIGSADRRDNSIIKRGDVAVWARAQGAWGTEDGDVEGPGYDQTQRAFYAGLDYAVGDDILVGFVAGYYDNEMRFDNGNRKDDDGVQLGLYAEYDTQKFYVRGIGGYASYNADSVRNINFGSTVGTNFGQYDSTVTSFMVETGRRFELSESFYFTPYGGLAYAKTKSDAFTETGLAASALAASSNTAKSFKSNLGARFTAAWDAGSNSKVIFEFGGGWEHEFKDDPILFNTSFASAAGSGFTVMGSVIDPESFTVSASISLATAGGFEFKASYWGHFNSNYKVNSAGVKLLKRF